MREALDDFDALIKEDPDAGDALRYRAMTLARLGRKPDALAELEKFVKASVPQ